MTEDTYAGQEDDPLSLNLYSYCHNDPINFTDPTGHWEEGDQYYSYEQQIEISAATDDWFAAQARGDESGMEAAHQRAIDARNSEYYSGIGTVDCDGFHVNVSSAMSDNVITRDEWNNISNYRPTSENEVMFSGYNGSKAAFVKESEQSGWRDDNWHLGDETTMIYSVYDGADFGPDPVRYRDIWRYNRDNPNHDTAIPYITASQTEAMYSAEDGAFFGDVFGNQIRGLNRDNPDNQATGKPYYITRFQTEKMYRADNGAYMGEYTGDTMWERSRSNTDRDGYGYGYITRWQTESCYSADDGLYIGERSGDTLWEINRDNPYHDGHGYLTRHQTENAYSREDGASYLFFGDQLWDNQYWTATQYQQVPYIRMTDGKVLKPYGNELAGVIKTDKADYKYKLQQEAIKRQAQAAGKNGNYYYTTLSDQDKIKLAIASGLYITPYGYIGEDPVFAVKYAPTFESIGQNFEDFNNALMMSPIGEGEALAVLGGRGMGKIANILSKLIKSDEIVNGVTETNFYVSANGKVIPSIFKDWIGVSQRDALLNSVSNEQLKNAINQLYRKGSVIGDGGTASIITFERETGILLSKSGHVQKGIDMSSYLSDIINSGSLTDTESQIANKLLNDLQKVLKGAK